MDKQNEKNKYRPMILVGPDGQTMHMGDRYQNPDRWEAHQTQDLLVMVARPEDPADHRDQLMEKIVAYVDANLTQHVTLTEVARYCGVSVSTVTQLFQKKSQLTFHRYLTHRRMALAQQLIRAGIPLEEVGRRVGYRDHSSFYRAFKQTFGQSPREYKQT